MDALILTILVATIPVFVLLYYFYRRDKGQKEPMRLMRKVFIWGVIVTIPVALFEGFLDLTGKELLPSPPLIYYMLYPFLFVALPEELGKLWVVWKKAYDDKAFNELMDGITYCILASMGFAIFENVLYTLQFGVGTGVLRAFTAVPAHALFSGIMGFYIGLAKFEKNEKKRKKLFYTGLFAGVFFHGLYDFLLMSGIVWMILAVFPLLVYMWIILNRAIREVQGSDGKVKLRYF